MIRKGALQAKSVNQNLLENEHFGDMSKICAEHLPQNRHIKGRLRIFRCPVYLHHNYFGLYGNWWRMTLNESRRGDVWRLLLGIEPLSRTAQQPDD